MKKISKNMKKIIAVCFFTLIVLIAILVFKGNLISKKNINASVIDSVPSGSLITDVELYVQTIDSYNREKGTNYDYTHNFTSSELASLKYLYLYERGSEDFYSLSDISKMTGLEYLYITIHHFNRIANTLDLTTLTELKNLDLHSRVSSPKDDAISLDLSKNTKLKYLSLVSINLSNLDLSKNIELETVNITETTPLSELDLSKTNVKYFFAPFTSIEKINLVNKNLENLFIFSPTVYDGNAFNKTTGYLIFEKGKTVESITNISANPLNSGDPSGDNINIVCGKNNIQIGETTKCTLLGYTTSEVSGIMAKLSVNENISISNVENISGWSGDSLLLYGDAKGPGRFAILSFDVTGVSRGIGTFILDDYDSSNPLGFVKQDSDIIPLRTGVHGTIYVQKYAIKDSSSNFKTTGNLATNNILNINPNINVNGNINSLKDYEDSYYIVIQGDVRADGIVNLQDVVKAYNAVSKADYSNLTTAEKYSIDVRYDGKYNLQDIVSIYNLAK